MSGALARLAVRRGRGIIFGWLLLLAVSGWFAVKLPEAAKEPGLSAPGTHAQVQRALAERFGIPARPVLLLFERETGVARSRFDAFIRSALARVEAAGGFGRIDAPNEGAGRTSGRYAYATLSFDAPGADRAANIRRLRALLPVGEGISVRVTGEDAVQADVNATSQADLRQAERIGLPIALLILWLALGGLVPALIPIASGMVAVVGAMGVLYAVGRHLALSVFVIDVLPMVGLSLSIDFALLMASRFRSELRRRPIEEALARTIASSGGAVAASGLCMLFGLIGILWIRMPIFRSVALGAMIAVALSVLAALTLVPALLASMGDRFRTPEAGTGPKGHWLALSGFVMRRPAAVACAAAALLAVCILPAAGMRLAIPTAASLPSETPSRQAAALWEQRFGWPGATQAWLLAESRGTAFGPEDWRDAREAVRRLAANPHVLRVDTALQGDTVTAGAVRDLPRPMLARLAGMETSHSFNQGNLLLISVMVGGEAGSREAQEGIRSLDAQVGGLRLYASGEAKYHQEVLSEIRVRLLDALSFIFAANGAALVWMFRSLVVPLKAILLNFASIAASFGLTTWLFASGRLGGGDSDIAVMIPVFVFGLTFGISMDYGVFLFARIREIYTRTGDNERAVREGLAQTGPVITAAAAIMLAVTLPFAFGGVAGVRQLGIGIAAAVFIDATIVRLLLVPALMKLLGRWNWWLP
ncbi:MMPL family transporter [Cohnella nanjingensis]|uniref:MMPL family transporter n=1 Tax=Cohnella nanjingensis TaxID=1387779 RepID=A0A7X0RUP2_9BACL|nr:MMPL family transporter [Cohnella nanjingensis]MBB6672750.1 MMPL family transporter [Cohnella nanjingensis]